jgi:membrane associated rhomboid family serine protease
MSERATVSCGWLGWLQKTGGVSLRAVVRRVFGWLWSTEEPASLLLVSWATWAISGLIVVMYIIQETWGATGRSSNHLVQALASRPESVAHGQWWRLVTYELINPALRHAGQSKDYVSAPAHVTNNLAVLLAFGPRLEAQLGRITYLVLWPLAGAAGAAWSAWVSVNGSAAGSSGSMAGVIGAVVVLAFVRRATGAQRWYGWAAAAFLVVFIVVSGLQFTVDRVHLGGAVAGAAMSVGSYAASRLRGFGRSLRVLSMVLVLGAVLAFAGALTAA